MSACGAAVAFWWALVSQHRAFNSNAYDLGFFDQLIWNTAQGRLFENSFLLYHFLGQHVEPVLLVYAAVYKLWPSVEVLLASQALAAGAAAIPLYYAARRWTGSPWSACLIAGAFLLSASLHHAVLFDFHPEVSGLLPLFAAAAFAAAGRPGWSLAALGSLFLLKEEAAVVAVGFAWLLWLQCYRKHAAALTASSALYFVLVYGVMMTAFRGGGPGDIQERYGYLGTDLLGIVAGLITQPGAVVGHLSDDRTLAGLWGMAARLGFLPLLTPAGLAAVPLALLHALSLHPEQRWLTLHYGALPFGLLMLAAVHGVGRLSTGRAARFLGGTRSPVVLSAALLAAAAIGWLSGSPLGLHFKPDRYELTDHGRAVYTVLARVPAGASVSAQSGLVPHLSQRRDIFEFPRLGGAQVVVIDRKSWKSSYAQAAGYDTVLAGLPGLGYRLATESDGVELYCREGRCE